jgi:hypothetical protein
MSHLLPVRRDVSEAGPALLLIASFNDWKKGKLLIIHIMMKYGREEV